MENEIICPLCQIILDPDTAEIHVNQCIDNSGIVEEIEAYEQTADLVEDDYDPVNKEDIECPICMDVASAGSGYTFKECGHSYCGDCLGGYYHSMIMNNQVLDIKCPNPSCDYECSYHDIRFILPDNIFDKYLEFSRNALINRDPTMRWCPAQGCGYAFSREDPNTLLMDCPNCNYEFCFDCGKDYHKDMTCAQFTKYEIAHNKNIDLRVMIWQKMYTKQCPKCKGHIQKNGGCNHMTCENCGHEFCWQCSKDYTSNHFDSGWCTMYGQNVSFHRAKKIGRKVFSTILRRNYSSMSYSSSYTSSSDEESIFNILEEKAEQAKEEIGERWEDTKGKVSFQFAKFRSMFDR
eukprot:TRINITY_DN2625_c1_g2_i2.p1 TRINITY_DN2625_c1_g2~~TRINITY_DN2625_c1_g2_i2.p1  ORF type:complete len:349 (+),score=68.22 TRINITY_DN2625_c1_g2_i2:472-1518(+)